MMFPIDVPPGGFMLKVIPARGGIVVTAFKGSGDNGEIYVIADGKDVGEEIGKIITMHYLTNPNDKDDR